MSEAFLSTNAILRAIRDARTTRGSERELLYALVLRINPSKGMHCWPSYSLLGRDTQLDVTTLKRAAKSLEQKGFIKRRIRKNRSNIFFVNVEPFLREAAQNKLRPDETIESPFASSSPAEIEVDEENGTDWISGGQR